MPVVVVVDEVSDEQEVMPEYIEGTELDLK